MLYVVCKGGAGLDRNTGRTVMITTVGVTVLENRCGTETAAAAGEVVCSHVGD